MACARCEGNGLIAIADETAQAIAKNAISAEAVNRKPLAIATDAREPASRRTRELLPRPRVPVVFVGALAAVLAVMAGLGYRHVIVQHWPQTASLYAAIGLPVNLRGLALHDVHVRLIDTSGEQTLGVEGEITNLKRGRNNVPPLRLSLRDKNAREVYVLTTQAPKAQIAGGETLTFNAHLAAPPAVAEAVLVSFAPAASDSLALQR